MAVPKMEELTLREKIGQTVVLRHTHLREITDIEAYFSENPVGFMWLMGLPKEVYRAVETECGNPELLGRRDDMYINLLNKMNRCMRVPLMPALDAMQGIDPAKFEDHEGLPSFAGLGATRDTDLAYRYGKVLGDDIHSIGFRWLWSPVADNSGRFSGTRTLSADTELNCEMLPAFIRGLQAAGVASGVKHFPGTDPYEYRDSHFCSASYSQSFEYWKKTQGREFQACIDAGADSVMVGHKTFRAVDDTCVNGAMLPCTLSHKVVTGLLKEKMGFDGVVLTDDADMKGLTAIYTEEKLYVELLRAGIDVVLGPTRLDYIDIIEKAVHDGELPESRIDDACRRVLRLKEKYGLFDEGEVPHPTEEQRATIKKNISRLCEDVAEKGLTLTANRIGAVPFKRETVRRVKIFYIGYSAQCFENLRYAAEEFARHGAECEIQEGYTKSDTATLKEYDLILYATFIGFHAPAGGPFFFGKECRMMWDVMKEERERSVAVSFGNTDIFFNYFTAAPTFVNCYSFNKETMEGLVKGLYGEITFTDYNPFPLNPITRTDEVY